MARPINYLARLNRCALWAWSMTNAHRSQGIIQKIDAVALVKKGCSFLLWLGATQISTWLRIEREGETIRSVHLQPYPILADGIDIFRDRSLHHRQASTIAQWSPPSLTSFLEDFLHHSQNMPMGSYLASCSPPQAKVVALPPHHHYYYHRLTMLRRHRAAYPRRRW